MDICGCHYLCLQLRCSVVSVCFGPSADSPVYLICVLLLPLCKNIALSELASNLTHARVQSCTIFTNAAMLERHLSCVNPILPEAKENPPNGTLISEAQVIYETPGAMQPVNSEFGGLI